MTSGETWKVGDRVTLSHTEDDASDWMVGHPATIDRLSTHFGEGPRLLFDPIPVPGNDPDDNWDYATEDGWWVNANCVIPLRTVETSHEVW